MNKQITNVVISLLEQYHDTKRKIAVLRYELEHPATVSPDEMIRAMSFAHGDGEGHAAGHGCTISGHGDNWRALTGRAPCAF